jgi:hypothetical protein
VSLKQDCPCISSLRLGEILYDRSRNIYKGGEIEVYIIFIRAGFHWAQDKAVPNRSLYWQTNGKIRRDLSSSAVGLKAAKRLAADAGRPSTAPTK